jgi:hypothetical protein
MMHLTRLKETLNPHEDPLLFPCIVDLVENGIDKDRFSSHERMPSRQDVTQFLAAWFRHNDVAQDVCQDWLIDYCVSVLAPMSSSSKSRIIHSTKSNIKYIYGANIDFNCRCMDNHFKATCHPSCKIYDQMLHKHRNAGSLGITGIDTNKTEKTKEPILSTKEAYKDQFIKATKIIIEQNKSNSPRKDIVKLLNDQGFKTRTGRSWSIAILRHELAKMKSSEE